MKLAKWGVLLISVVVVLATLLAACAKPAPAPAPAPAPVPSPAPAPKAIKFKMVDWLTPAHWSAPLWTEFFKRVKDRTGGRLEITMVDAKAAGLKWGDTLPTLKDGTYEMNDPPAFYLSGEGKLFGAGWLPVLIESVTELAVARHVLKDLYQAELDKWNTLILVYMPYEDQFPGATKPLTKPSDYKGLRLRPVGAESGKLASALGATPVSIPITDAYMAFQKGLLDGLVGMGMSGWRSYGFHEVVPYITDFTVNAGDGFVLVSKKHYDALPADVKAVLLEEAARFEDKYWKGIRELAVEVRKFVLEKGNKIVTPTEELKTEIRRLAKPIIDQWGTEGGPTTVAALKAIRAILYK